MTMRPVETVMTVGVSVTMMLWSAAWSSCLGAMYAHNMGQWFYGQAHARRSG